MKSLWQKLGQAGQGTVEYVLLLGLTVAIILGVVLQFNKAFKVWADNYFGEYLTCLLETGELPTLGGTTTTGECAAAFKPFNIADGGEKDGTGGSSGGGSDSEDKDNEDSGGSGGSTSLGSRSSDSASSINRFRSGRSRVNVATRGSAGGGDEDDKKSDDQNGEGSFNSYDQGRNSSQKRILVQQTDAVKKRRIEEGKKDRGRTKVKSDTDLAGDRPGAPALQRYKKRTVASTAGPDEGFEFTFGNILRWLIIIALLLALLLIIGSQIRQVSKSID